MTTQTQDRVTRIHAKWLPSNGGYKMATIFMPMVLCGASGEASIKAGLITPAKSTSCPDDRIVFRPLFGAN